MRYQEIVLCSSGASSSSQSLGSVSVHDFRTGSLLASYKQTSAHIHSTSVFETKNGQGGFILTAQSDKSIMNAYYFQKVRERNVYHCPTFKLLFLTSEHAFKGSTCVKDGFTRKTHLYRYQ